MNSTIKVKCKVEDGMFNSERLVTIDTRYGEIKSAVSSDLIEGDTIKLTVDSEDKEDYIVIIPGMIFIGCPLVRIKKDRAEDV